MFLLKFLSFVNLAYQKIVRLSILYERNIKYFDHKFTLELLNKILEEYNQRLKESNVKFRIDSIMDYSNYSKQDYLKEFTKISGSSDLKLKLESLKNVNKNLIIIYTGDEESNLNIVNTCRDRYFLNMNNYKYSSDEILRISLEGIKGYMKLMLKINIPEFYELDNNVFIKNESEDLNSSIYPEIIQNILECHNENNNEIEYDKKLIKKNSFKKEKIINPNDLKYFKEFDFDIDRLKNFNVIKKAMLESKMDSKYNNFKKIKPEIKEMESSSSNVYNMNKMKINYKNNMRNQQKLDENNNDVVIEPENKIFDSKHSLNSFKNNVKRKDENFIDSNSKLVDDYYFPHHTKLSKRFIFPNKNNKTRKK